MIFSCRAVIFRYLQSPVKKDVIHLPAPLIAPVEKTSWRLSTAGKDDKTIQIRLSNLSTLRKLTWPYSEFLFVADE
jgi:hypothetical protein